MSWFYKPYVSIAERRRKAEQEISALTKDGQILEPVTAATPRGTIAKSFWGQAWCKHLESYSDYSNRLPRGRSYLRNGSVVHLGIEPGSVRALVMGSELYEGSIRIQPLPLAKWEALKRRCQGKIGSIVELLQGKLSNEIMAIVTDRNEGLFPSPKEIKLTCSCPDWASLCKHLAAVLYGVGARLDDAPELLFKLRGVDHTELVQTDIAALVRADGNGQRRRLDPAALGDVFGIDLDENDLVVPPPRPQPADKTPRHRPRRSRAATVSQSKKGPTKTALDPVSNRKSPPRKAPKAGAVKVPPFQATGRGVSDLRKRLNLTRSEFAIQLNVSSQSVANWERQVQTLKLHSRNLAALRKIHRSSYRP